jgi:hypothetical protein
MPTEFNGVINLDIRDRNAQVPAEAVRQWIERGTELS